jgi:hypothetical protein
MSARTDSLGAEVQQVIEDFGEDVHVLKYTGMLQDQYKQGAPIFAAAVTVRGHVAMDPTMDQIAMAGLKSEKEINGMITFSNPHLIAAFPATDIEDTVTLKDQIGFWGRRWGVADVHYTGRINAIPIVVTVGLCVIPGREKETYP